MDTTRAAAPVRAALLRHISSETIISAAVRTPRIILPARSIRALVIIQVGASPAAIIPASEHMLIPLLQAAIISASASVPIPTLPDLTISPKVPLPVIMSPACRIVPSDIFRATWLPVTTISHSVRHQDTLLPVLRTPLPAFYPVNRSPVTPT